MRTADTGNGRGKRHAAAETPPAPRTSRLTPHGCVSFCTRPGSAGSKPIFFASHPIGGALLSAGIPAVVPSVAASLSSVLPVGLSGLDVREPLHRFDANLHAPTLEGGLASANRVGEPLASLTMRWLLAPDGFEATPGSAPPDTEIQRGLSQRFVMQDGEITFEGRGRGALRFFGAGRTYPSTTDGQPHLLFAGTAVIVEGTGSLKGVRGTLMLSGEVTQSSSMALNVVGHLDAGPIRVEDTLGRLMDAASADTEAAVLILAGESDAGGEQIRGARVGNDLVNASRLRSFFRTGEPVGTVTGSLTFDPADRRCSVPLSDAIRVVSFSDPAGRVLGTITAEGLEGTAAPEVRDGQTINRVVAYGEATRGTGALAGVGGVLTFEAAVEPSGRTTTLYVLRLTDPAGRLRAAHSDTYQTTKPFSTSGAPSLASAETLRFVEVGETMADTDRAIFQHADRTLAEGAELLRWWEDKDRGGDYSERFGVVREFNNGDRSFGFFDTAAINNAPLPVVGIVQEMFYDRQKVATGDAVRDQMKEFILRYFMRMSHLRQPDAVPGGPAQAMTLQKILGWWPGDVEQRAGFRYQQLYYKLKESGKIGKFGKERQSAIVDLREIGDVYDWIVLKVKIYDFSLSFAPFGGEAPKMQVPLQESAYLVLGPPFVKHADNPEPGVLARYGFGYAFLPCAPEGPGVIAYGPGHFTAAIQTVEFTVRHDGEVRARAAFVVNRPDQIVSVDIAPVDWGFQLADLMTFGVASRVMSPMKAIADRLPLRVDGVDVISAFVRAANAMTGGLAASQLGISKPVLEKRMLLQHFMQHHAMLITSLLVWRTVPDWTDHDGVLAVHPDGVIGE